MRTLPSPIPGSRLAFFVWALCFVVVFTVYSTAASDVVCAQQKKSESSDNVVLPAKEATLRVVQASSDQPLWKVDLHSMGYPQENHLLQWQRGLGSFNTVDFISDSIVAETFVTQEPAAGLQRRNDPNRARPYRLHAIFFDAAT